MSKTNYVDGKLSSVGVEVGVNFRNKWKLNRNEDFK